MSSILVKRGAKLECEGCHDVAITRRDLTVEEFEIFKERVNTRHGACGHDGEGGQ